MPSGRFYICDSDEDPEDTLDSLDDDLAFTPQYQDSPLSFPPNVSPFTSPLLLPPTVVAVRSRNSKGKIWREINPHPIRAPAGVQGSPGPPDHNHDALQEEDITDQISRIPLSPLHTTDVGGDAGHEQASTTPATVTSEPPLRRPTHLPLQAMPIKPRPLYWSPRNHKELETQGGLLSEEQAGKLRKRYHSRRDSWPSLGTVLTVVLNLRTHFENEVIFFGHVIKEGTKSFGPGRCLKIPTHED
ncbi:hypothetical protein NLI96_g11195 [Meripilus lineatus]|uniref:Uncharacterized protein n=1 Tax=Meripilus lineatus TaxID=2056292 RepID=A0AAD5Y8M3_9APHY|nr:hypothetical protein NLI96_g11195 [Physisporinus lineatus]